MKKLWIGLIILTLALLIGCRDKKLPIIDTYQLERDYGGDADMQTLIDLIITPGDEFLIWVHPNHQSYMFYTDEEIEQREWVEGVKRQLKLWDNIMEDKGRTDVSETLKNYTE